MAGLTRSSASAQQVRTPACTGIHAGVSQIPELKMTDFKVSRETSAFYRRWVKFIRDDHPKLPKGIKRATLIAYCLTQASYGTNGIECYASDAVIAKDLEIYHRDDVTRYRHCAVDLGWFTPTGERKGRTAVLNISIPGGSNLLESQQISKTPKAPEVPVPDDDSCPHTNTEDAFGKTWCNDCGENWTVGSPPYRGNQA